MPATAPMGRREVASLTKVLTPSECRELSCWAECADRDDLLRPHPVDAGVKVSPFLDARGGRTQVLQEAATRVPVQVGTYGPVWMPNGPSDWLMRLPEAYWRARQRVVERLRLTDLEPDPYKGDFVAWIPHGASIHPHIDDRIQVGAQVCDVLRCNVVFSAPRSGGVPRISGLVFPTAPGEAWAFYASCHLHSADVVVGPGGRGSISFGFLVPLDMHRGFQFAWRGTVRAGKEPDVLEVLERGLASEQGGGMRRLGGLDRALRDALLATERPSPETIVAAGFSLARSLDILEALVKAGFLSNDSTNVDTNNRTII